MLTWAETDTTESAQVGELPPDAVAMSAPGLQNLIAVGTNLFSGSAPDGRQGFESLAKLGIKTIITVDGAQPNAVTARQWGMRYVHLPHGYDGIDFQTQQLLAKAAHELEGPIYVHCHHGRHRGPAATAVICMSDLGKSREWAEALLVAAGTSPIYVGLYQTIREFTPTATEALAAVPGRFPESADVSGLVEAMVEIDERWENLKAVQSAGYRTPSNHPDIVPANESVILWELYREVQRLPELVEEDQDMGPLFREAEAMVREAEQLLRSFAENESADIRVELDRVFDGMSNSCAGCHREHRDQKKGGRTH